MQDRTDTLLRQRFALVEAVEPDEAFVVAVQARRRRLVFWRRTAATLVGMLLCTSLALSLRTVMAGLSALPHVMQAPLRWVQVGPHSLASWVVLAAIAGAAGIGVLTCVWAWRRD